MSEFKSWEEMSVLEQYACQYWDMYKDCLLYTSDAADE